MVRSIAQLILNLLVLATLSLLLPVTNSFANIGKITGQTGPTEIQRNREIISSIVSSVVQMNDSVVTAKSNTEITFNDNTKVQVTEQSKLVIDTFIFDPNKSDAGRLGIKIAIGTARVASGQIAKNNPQNVKVETPTATIAVRGTDFSMTVDELGRSLIILLPSCPVGWKNIDRDCKTGRIDVTTEMGTVTLNKPFQSTKTESKESNPARPITLQLGFDQINNMLILTKIKANIADERSKTALDINFLDRNLLAFGDLDQNLLTENGNRLDINFLDSEFLYNLIDLANSALLASMFDPENQMLPNYKANRVVGLKYYIENNNITLYRNGLQSFAQITVDKDVPSTVNLTQDQTSIQQIVNRSSGSNITIIQGK